jgi:alkanesulfonate monooxygenase SsuD/methylene tetrahydromethanopterin reductase-like flavin-dependent oxidoreductase (luciferase family)
MDVGIQTIFASHGWDGISDAQVYEEDTRLALLAADLGFDVVWAVEHHFFDYSFCPDNVAWLSYIAGRHPTVHLGTAAVIMPWNDPLRVAERIALLDQVSGGRVRFGMGRGLSRREFALFGEIEMEESRERFDEGSMMVKAALETGYIEGHGTFFEQPRAPLRPAPTTSFDGRLYSVASSDDSIEAAARLKARMTMFSDRSWASRKPSIDRWRDLFRDLHGEEPPPPLVCDFVYCSADAGDERGPQYMAAYLQSVLEHYEILGDHFEGLKGYDAYASAATVLRRMGETGFMKGFLDATASGTPDHILETYRARWDLLGPFEAAPAFRFGGVPYEDCEASLRLFAAEVLPVLQSWE